MKTLHSAATKATLALALSIPLLVGPAATGVAMAAEAPAAVTHAQVSQASPCSVSVWLTKKSSNSFQAFSRFSCVPTATAWVQMCVAHQTGPTTWQDLLIGCQTFWSISGTNTYESWITNCPSKLGAYRADVVIVDGNDNWYHYYSYPYSYC